MGNPKGARASPLVACGVNTQHAKCLAYLSSAPLGYGFGVGGTGATRVYSECKQWLRAPSKRAAAGRKGLSIVPDYLRCLPWRAFLSRTQWLAPTLYLPSLIPIESGRCSIKRSHYVT